MQLIDVIAKTIQITRERGWLSGGAAEKQGRKGQESWRAGGQVEMAVAWTVSEDGERISWPHQVMLADADEIEVLYLPRLNRVGVAVLGLSKVWGADTTWGIGTSINDGLYLWHDLFLWMYSDGP